MILYTNINYFVLPCTGLPDANKSAWRNIPVEDCGHNDSCDMDLGDDSLLQGGDSDVDSAGDSDTDPLQSAGVWTDIETVKIHLTHLNKLKVFYMICFVGSLALRR